MSQPRTMEERVTALESELNRLRPRTVTEDADRDTATVPAINVRERMEGRRMEGEGR